MEQSTHPRTGIPAAELQARRERCSSTCEPSGCTGYVLFDQHYIQYFTGFGFLSTERPVVFAQSASGEMAVFVPEFEVERVRAETALRARSSPIPSTRGSSTRCASSRACSPTSASAGRSAPIRTATRGSSATRARR